MATIDDLIGNILGQTDQALNAGPAPWQQELLESVNPEKVRRQNIARALAKASTAMATTPGNFLSGVAAAASTGADAYLTGRDEAEDQRIKVQQLLQMQQQKDQDRRLGLLMDALGVQRNKIADEQSTERHNMGLEKDRAYVDYYKRRGTNTGGLSPAQIETNRRYVDRVVTSYETSLRESGQYNEQEIADLVEEKRIEKEMEFGLTGAGSAPGDNVSQSDLFTPGGSSPGGGTAQVLTPEQYEGILPQQAQPPSNQSGVRVNSKAEYDRLPSGTVYIAPDGTQRRKP